MAEETVFLVRVLNLERDSGYFHASFGGEDATKGFTPGERCVVDHNGLRLGVVMSVLSAGEGIGEQLERIVRWASPSDLDAYAHNQADAERVLSSTREVIAHHNLPMHLVAAEYTLDRSQLRIYFTAPHRVDFRLLLRDLAGRYGTRIELRQMGARDEARLKGGIGRCGQILCCHRFLHEPNPVPMELAYDQELFVPPERITGICGRLMCCLAYEHDVYRHELAKMPKLGTWVVCSKKRGKVIAHNIFRQTVTILTGDKERIEVNASTVRPSPPGRKAP
jgi:cell fate regulator YaaT (PSP1 superfamily)